MSRVSVVPSSYYLNGYFRNHFAHWPCFYLEEDNNNVKIDKEFVPSAGQVRIVNPRFLSSKSLGYVSEQPLTRRTENSLMNLGLGLGVGMYPLRLTGRDRKQRRGHG